MPIPWPQGPSSPQQLALRTNRKPPGLQLASLALGANKALKTAWIISNNLHKAKYLSKICQKHVTFLGWYVWLYRPIAKMRWGILRVFNKPNYTVNFDFSLRQFLKSFWKFYFSSFVFSEDIKIDLITIKNTFRIQNAFMRKRLRLVIAS